MVSEAGDAGSPQPGSAGPGPQPDSPQPDIFDAAARKAASALVDTAIARVQDPGGRVRAEDFLAVLAALTGEATLVASGVMDIEATDLTPGAPVFGDPMNLLLTGDQLDPAAAPPGSVVGVLVRELVPDVVPLDAFADLRGAYARMAAGVGAAGWGGVVTSVPEANQPRVLPIQVAYELREAVGDALGQSGLPAARRHELCALALASGLRLAKGAIDPRVAVTLALEVTFGMAKMVPMSRRAYEAMAKPG